MAFIIAPLDSKILLSPLIELNIFVLLLSEAPTAASRQRHFSPWTFFF